MPTDPDRRRTPAAPLTAEQVAARRPLMLAVLLGVLAPAAITVIAFVVQIFLLGDVPDRVIVHWNATGTPDGWSPAWTVPLVTAILCLFLIGIMAVPAVVGLNAGDRGRAYPSLVAATLGTTAMVAVLMTSTLWFQKGGRDDEPLLTTILLSLAVGLVLGTAAWFAQPHPTESEIGAQAAPIAVADGEQAVWLRTVTASRGMLIVTVGAVTLASLIALFGWTDGTSSGLIVTCVIVALAGVVVLMTSLAFRVRVSPDGLSVRSILGLPRFSIALGQIAGVRVDGDARPLGDFGGCGVRWTGKTTAVALRRGPAIIVERTNGKRFAVIVDDAPTGAGLLEAYRQQAVADASADRA
ncbi:MAG: DUF1648 domain-containing protein [Gordonia sp. (in: high G+C Gram-positive bacteria)]|uniref:DUF1648 domain-containing protein n=1 Tax=Gordonia sp. (in: high G+C Gram-positive bacteria) TaxID=84139 RepID=UPI0039E232FE